MKYIDKVKIHADIAFSFVKTETLSFKWEHLWVSFCSKSHGNEFVQYLSKIDVYQYHKTVAALLVQDLHSYFPKVIYYEIFRA